MSDRITLNFDANTQRAEEGTDRIADGLDKTAKALDDVGEAGEKGGDQAAEGLDKVTDSADDLGSKGDDVIGGLQDGLLGVAGVAGGVAGVVSQAFGTAYDFIKDKIDEQIQASEELRAGLVAAYRQAAEEGNKYLEQAQIIAAANDIFFDAGKRERAAADAAAIGVDALTFIKAQAGDYQALLVVVEATAQAEQKRRDEGAGAGSKAEQAAAVQELQNLERIRDANQDLLSTHQEAQEAAQGSLELQAQLSEEARQQIKRVQTADQERYEALAAQQRKAASPPPIVQTVRVDTAAAEAALKRFTDRQRNIQLGVVYRNGKQVLQ